MSKELIRAYRRALFRVFDPGGEFVMTVDVPSSGLLRCHARHGAESSLFITAWNPGSVVQADAVNAAAQERLRKTIAGSGYAVLEGCGQDPDGGWVPEASFLVLGVSEAEARRLGREFGQLAVVFAGPDGIPRLLISGSKGGLA